MHNLSLSIREGAEGFPKLFWGFPTHSRVKEAVETVSVHTADGRPVGPGMPSPPEKFWLPKSKISKEKRLKP